MRWGRLPPLLLLAAAAPDKVVADLDLSRPFGLPAGWRLVATRGPDVPGVTDGQEPGVITLCLRRPDAACDPALHSRVRAPVSADDYYTDAHYLKRAATVRPRGVAAAPLLLVQTGSMFSGDGGQVNGTQVLAYDAASRQFERIFDQDVGGGTTNQEIRYVDAGPFRGAIVVAVPAQHAPFGYWITVNQLTPALRYRQTVRFLSSTRYGDGNPLAVIDSEMPNIERRLGLWHPGQPLPLPAKPCPRPHLVGGALWCTSGP